MSAISTKDLAEWLGVSTTTINSLADRGLVVKLGRAQFDHRASVTKYLAHLRETAAGRGGEKGVLDLTAERARQAKEHADKLALENEITRGNLLKAEDVLAEWSDITSRIRRAVLSLTSRIRHQISSIDATQADIIDREVRLALEALADDQDYPPADAGEVETSAADEAVQVA